MPQSFEDLIVYQKAFGLAMEVFQITINFPKEERYALTDQIRRSSRSVCANTAEAYRKRQYNAHFISKISDADMENSETQVWLEFALTGQCISQATHDHLTSMSQEIGRMLNHMMTNPEKYKRMSKLR